MQKPEQLDWKQKQKQKKQRKKRQQNPAAVSTLTQVPQAGAFLLCSRPTQPKLCDAVAEHAVTHVVTLQRSGRDGGEDAESVRILNERTNYPTNLHFRRVFGNL